MLPGDVRDEVYQDLGKAESSWKEIIPDSSLQPTDKAVQALWDTPLYEKRYLELLASESNPTEEARLKGISTTHSSEWLNAIPIPGMGLKMEDANFRVLYGLRLGLPLCWSYT